MDQNPAMIAEATLPAWLNASSRPRALREAATKPELWVVIAGGKTPAAISATASSITMVQMTGEFVATFLMSSPVRLLHVGTPTMKLNTSLSETEVSPWPMRFFPIVLVVLASLGKLGQTGKQGSLDAAPNSTTSKLGGLNNPTTNASGSRATVHGFRASFSTWANEKGARADVIEACLAHKEADRVRAAYNRAQLLNERRQLLIDWGNYCLVIHVKPAQQPSNTLSSRIRIRRAVSGSRT
jgi:hypothetical protein